MLRRMVVLTVLFVMGGFCGTIMAGGPRVEVERIDGSRVRGVFAGATESGVSVVVDGVSSETSFHALRSLRFSGMKLPADRRVRDRDRQQAFYFDAGGHVSGTMLREADEAIVAELSFGGGREKKEDDGVEGGVTMPFSSLSGIWFGGEKTPVGGRAMFDEFRANRLAGKDILITVRDGQLGNIRGGLLGLGPKGGRIWYNRKERRFKLDQVVAIVFGTGVSDDRSWGSKLEMADGSLLPGRILGGSADRVEVETPFAEHLSIPLDGVRGIHFDSDRVAYLSEMTPVRQEATGLLLDPMAAKFDLNAANGPLVLDGKLYARGIGSHSRSEIEFAIGGDYETFAAMIGIDDSVRPHGSVVFKVLGDGAELFDSGTVTGGTRGQLIRVDIRGVRRLTLLVEMADAMELGDQADWCDARLIRPAPGVEQ